MPDVDSFGAEELAAIVDLFHRNGGVTLAHGFDHFRNGIYKVREFEHAFASHIGSGFAQAVSSGSAALKVALTALGVGPGDEVITQAFTFVATVEAIRETGATPIIVDIDDTLGMSADALERAITPRTKAVIPVHMMGEAVEIDSILAVAKRHQITILEDAAEAMGASYNQRKVGTFGTLGAFSTNAYKMINTGEGGLVVTDLEDLYIKVRGAHDHGHEYSKTLSRLEEQAIISGFNYRMTELQGAIGLVQLSKLERAIQHQRANKRMLLERLRNPEIRFRRSPDVTGDIGDTIVMYLPTARYAADFMTAMADEKIDIKILPGKSHWHFAKYWKRLFEHHPIYATEKDHWGASAKILECSVALPVKVNMSIDHIDSLCDKLNAIARKFL